MAKNSEVYKNAQERAEAFRRFCNSFDEHCHGCPVAYDCSMKDDIIGSFAWLDLEAEEEKPLPCPFCGGETVVRSNWNSTHQVVCNSQGCWYCSKCETTSADAIAAHNRVSKDVREGK